MKKNLTLHEYRAFDIVLFTILMIVFETIAVKAIGWFNEIYAISLFFAINLIVMMRWGAWSIVTILAGAVTFCLANGGSTNNYLVYIIGDLFLLSGLLWFKIGKNQIRTNSYFLILFVISSFIMVELGRSLVAMFLGSSFISIFIGFLGTDSLNCLLALLIIFIARKQDGVFEDQIAYIKRVKEEENSPSLEV